MKIDQAHIELKAVSDAPRRRQPRSSDFIHHLVEMAGEVALSVFFVSDCNRLHDFKLEHAKGKAKKEARHE